MPIEFPSEWKTDAWHGGLRHRFELDGHDAWFIEPETPAGDGRWSWCMVWPEAFVERVGVEDLLKRGFYHAHVDAFATRANPEGQTVLRKFHELAVRLGLAPQVNLIGLSWGGFFSLRYASENPDKVACIYLDAPVCNMADRSTPAAEARFHGLAAAYAMDEAAMTRSPLNPINALAPIVEARIPIFAATGEADVEVPVANNIDIVERRIHELGGSIVIRRRPGRSDAGRTPARMSTPPP